MYQRAKRHYTLPFFTYQDLHKETPSLEFDLFRIENKHYINFAKSKIQIDYAISALDQVIPKTQDQTLPESAAGRPVVIRQILERATDISTWLLYLKATDLESRC